MTKDCVDIAPSINWKCIVFSLALSGGYWFSPKKNKWILLALIYFPYLILAYYDYYYKCERNMGPTYLALFYWKFKPKNSDQIKTYDNWCPKYKNKVFIVDIFILFGLILGIPLFLRWNPSKK